MFRSTSFSLAAAALALLFVAPGLLSAQGSSTGNYTFKIGLMGGLGGSIDEDDPGLDNSTIQLSGSMVTEANVQVGVRLGKMEFGTEQSLGDLFDAELTYATIAGEYTFGEVGYVSAVFLGLGVYELEGIDLPTGAGVSNTRVGVTLGASGEFDISKRLGVIAELSAHLLPSGEAQFFGSGLIGIAAYFR